MNLLKIYANLYSHFGPQQWWPVIGSGDREFEICVGAILTQNTSWKNVEMAIRGLKQKKLLKPCVLAKCQVRSLQRIIRSSGYYRQKAKKLKIFTNYICQKYGGNTRKMLAGNVAKKRHELLGIWGLGRETVDSMLLYAAKKPIFVIDAYTKRLCKEIGVEFADYDEYQEYFEGRLPKRSRLFNEYHALIVAWGKLYTKDRTTAVGLIKKSPKRGEYG